MLSLAHATDCFNACSSFPRQSPLQRDTSYVGVGSRLTPGLWGLGLSVATAGQFSASPINNVRIPQTLPEKDNHVLAGLLVAE